MVENHGITRPLKRVYGSTRITADLSDFLTFPSPSPAAIASASRKPFSDAVRSFLSAKACLTTAFAPPVLPCLITWQILFRVGNFVTDARDPSAIVVALYVIEEDVIRSSRSVYCDQCRVVGWSGHPVCRMRFHFIIRCCDNAINGKENKLCPGSANPLHVSDSRRCKCCNKGDDVDVEEWGYSQFEDNTHLLHEVVHSHDYGPLLTVNGRGGSNLLSGFTS